MLIIPLKCTIYILLIFIQYIFAEENFTCDKKKFYQSFWYFDNSRKQEVKPKIQEITYYTKRVQLMSLI